MKRLQVVLFVLASSAIGCGDDPPKKDSTVFIDVVDINAKDTVPTPIPSRIRRIQLLSDLVGGTCRVQRYRGQAVSSEIVYDADRPRRTITLGLGPPSRAFRPMSLQIIGTQGDGVNNEQEFMVAAFSEEGIVTVGTRSYSSTGPSATSEKTQLGPGDFGDVIRFAQQLLAICADSVR